MAASFFFYDLETSGISPFSARIMQFAGQRTDLDLRPIGDPVNVLIRLSEDILPEPDAVLITGITPQQTIADGVTEAEFLQLFSEQAATPGTIMMGYNTVRFDDEFMRCLHYRNFYDPYEWQWQDGRSKWDLLDVVRMTRALRPAGIEWPFDVHGKPTNRLELLTALNKLDHAHAHDALSDVNATIAVARLIRNKQYKLFEYLLDKRDKRKVMELTQNGQPFVYVSGKYPSQFEKATVAIEIIAHPKKQGVLVYDLRHDPTQYRDLSPEQLAELWRWKKDSTEPRLPIKTLPYNKCPAVAPLNVLDAASQQRLHIDLAAVRRHAAVLASIPDLAQKLLRALELLENKEQTKLLSTEKDVDNCIYDGFFGPADKQKMAVVRAARPEELSDLHLDFDDHRLNTLLPLYKARNFRASLTSDERAAWEKTCQTKLLSGGQHSRMAKYFTRLQEIVAAGNLTSHQEYLIEELRLYGESIMPEAYDV